MSDPAVRRLEDLAVIVDADRDDVAVARQAIPALTKLHSDRFGDITLSADVSAGHRFALRAVESGTRVRQYGQPFAKSRGLRPGDPVDSDTVENHVPHVDAESIQLDTPVLPP